MFWAGWTDASTQVRRKEQSIGAGRDTFRQVKSFRIQIIRQWQRFSLRSVKELITEPAQCQSATANIRQRIP